VPGLDELVERPERADALPPQVACALLGQLSALQLRLAARLAMLVAAPAMSRNNPGDRLLTAKQVAERLGRGVNWVYENDLPFIIRQAGRRPRYSERGLERWMVAMQDGGGGHAR
jgi:hypothetical protein